MCKTRQTPHTSSCRVHPPIRESRSESRFESILWLHYFPIFDAPSFPPPAARRRRRVETCLAGCLPAPRRVRDQFRHPFRSPHLIEIFPSSALRLPGQQRGGSASFEQGGEIRSPASPAPPQPFSPHNQIKIVPRLVGRVAAAAAQGRQGLRVVAAAQPRCRGTSAFAGCLEPPPPPPFSRSRNHPSHHRAVVKMFRELRSPSACLFSEASFYFAARTQPPTPSPSPPPPRVPVRPCRFLSAP